jgi:1,4-alpha-glucan branching enzyme
MGSEFGQWSEWGHDHGLEWHLLDHAPHQGLLRWVRDLNGFYRDHSELYEDDFSLRSFEWLDFHDADASAISFLRKNEAGNKWVVAACNLTPVPRHHYRIGVPCAGVWKEALNSDAPIYGGSGCGNWGQVEAQAIPVHGRDHSLSVTLPPLSVVFFTHL